MEFILVGRCTVILIWGESIPTDWGISLYLTPSLFLSLSPSPFPPLVLVLADLRLYKAEASYFWLTGIANDIAPAKSATWCLLWLSVTTQGMFNMLLFWYRHLGFLFKEEQLSQMSMCRVWLIGCILYTQKGCMWRRTSPSTFGRLLRGHGRLERWKWDNLSL